VSTNEVIEKIRQLDKSETRLWKKILPRLDMPEGLKIRVKQQNEMGDSLKHYWKNFGSFEKFRQVRSSVFWPRVQGVFEFLTPYAKEDDELARWLKDHPICVNETLDAVGSIYAEDAARLLNRIHSAVSQADPQWEKPGTLSQKAIRALRSTDGVSVVLVGMRQKAYVDDVLSELKEFLPHNNRFDSWVRIRQELEEII
jgi:hypothetical protein